MKNWINYHHLLYFKIIAEENSVSRAAEILRLSQSTLSAQLKQFEDHLGVQLFDRRNRKLILTDQGKVTLDYAKNIFTLGNELYEVLSDKFTPSRTHLQIGALDGIAKQVTLEITKAAFKVGKCHVTVVEGKSTEILQELVTHKLDLVITNFIPISVESKGLLYRQFSKSEVAVFGSEKFKHLRKNFPESLEGQPFILPTYDSKLRYDLDHWFTKQKLKIDPVAESQDISLKKFMAIDGLGLIPVASHTVNRQVLSGELLQIGKLSPLCEELFLVSAQRKIENNLAQSLFKTFEL
jgi:LysR family transcriptional activator of nhaA